MVVKTTIDLPDPVSRELKALAARRGVSMKEIVLRAVEREIRDAARPAESPRFVVKLPLIRSQMTGKLPSMTNAEIEDLLD